MRDAPSTRTVIPAQAGTHHGLTFGGCDAALDRVGVAARGHLPVIGPGLRRDDEKRRDDEIERGSKP